MLRFIFIGHILAILTLAVKAGDFLQPWTAGPDKDYSNNIKYTVGVSIQAAWQADFTNATIVLTQDNRRGDAVGGPSVTLETSYNETIWSWSVSYEGIDPAYNNVFYFTVMPADGADHFTGHYFNISDASAATKSSATAAISTGSNAPASSGIMTSQPSSSTTGTVTPVTVVTSSAAGTIAASTSGGKPAGKTAGIAVSAAFGFLLLAGGTWWAWKIKKRRDTVPSSQPYFFRKQSRCVFDGKQVNGVHKFAEANGNEADGVHEVAGAYGKQISKVHESAGRSIYEM